MEILLTSIVSDAPYSGSISLLVTPLEALQYSVCLFANRTRTGLWRLDSPAGAKLTPQRVLSGTAFVVVELTVQAFVGSLLILAFAGIHDRG